jgi:SAM-dependent methyltransferase
VTKADAVRWDARYQAQVGAPLPAPDPLLLQYTPPPVIGRESRSRALDLACGRGQNGLWLAEQGYSTDLMDCSRVALTQARDEAGRRGLRTLNFLLVDLDGWTPEPDSYDLIAVFRFLDRRLFPLLRAAARPGGRILYETFHTGHLASHPSFNPAQLLEPGELAEQFADWRVLRASEDAESARIVALKPTGEDR